jgi:uncharacterized protein (DUF2267 family)
MLLYNWEEAHCSYSWQDHSSKGRINKGNILFSHSERVSIDTPQPDGSVVKTSVFRALYNHIPSGIMVLKRAASALIMSLYLIRYQHNYDYQDIS